MTRVSPCIRRTPGISPGVLRQANGVANSITVAHDVFDDLEWLTVPDLVEVLGRTQSQVRRLIEDRHLVAVRRDGVLVVPASFIRDRDVLTELHGTAIVLSDLHFTDDEIVRWLVSEDDALGATPIDALRSGRKAEVRRVAMTLA